MKIPLDLCRLWTIPNPAKSESTSKAFSHEYQFLPQWRPLGVARRSRDAARALTVWIPLLILCRALAEITLLRQWMVLGLVSAVGAGCAAKGGGGPSAPAANSSPSNRPEQSSAPANDPIIAHVEGVTITLQQLQKPLMEAYGLNLLLRLAELDLVKSDAAKAQITVTDADLQHEREHVLEGLFKEAPPEQDRQKLLDQFLAQRRISAYEFELTVQSNAYLRKIAEPLIKGKITEENLHEAFGVVYGETVQVRHIQCANMQEIAEAQRRLAAGEPFEKVAREMSRNERTAPLGGEVAAFSREQDLPQAFKDTAFALKEGQVSDPVYADGAYHLIKLEKRFPPKAVKFEDVKETLREQLHDRLLQVAINNLRDRIRQRIGRELRIEDPTLRQQLVEQLEKQQSEQKSRDQVRQEIEQQAERSRRASTEPATTTTQPATETSQPAAVAPASSPAPAATQPAAEHPPATRSGS